MTLMNDTGLALGQRFRAARLLANMEQADVARAVGVARQTISNWERGLAEPPVSQFVRFAQITGQPLDWFAAAVNAETAPLSEGAASLVRPEGFEPPAYCSGVSPADCSARSDRAMAVDRLFWGIVAEYSQCSCYVGGHPADCPCACHDGHSFWSIVAGYEVSA